MPQQDEEALVRLAQQGDETAFSALVEQYKNRVFGLIVRAVADRSKAEDLAQEVFLKVFRGLPYFRGEARFSTWFYRIVVNLCLQERVRHPVTEVSLDSTGRDDGARWEPSVRATAGSDLELRDRLEKAIARLPAKSRLLIAGHYLEGVRYDELAEALNMPLGTVKTDLHRAKRRLRLLLEKELA